MWRNAGDYVKRWGAALIRGAATNAEFTVFQLLQNNWLPWKHSKMSKFGHVTTFLSNNMTKSSKIDEIT